MSPGLVFKGQGQSAKVVPRNVLLVQRATSLPENTKSGNKPGGVKLWVVRSPGGPEVLQIYEGTYKSAASSHNSHGWHLRACIDFLHALATMLYCLHGPEERTLLMAPYREAFNLTDVEEHVLNRLIPLTRAPKVPRGVSRGTQGKGPLVFKEIVYELTQAAKNQDSRGFPGGWWERLPG